MSDANASITGWASLNGQILPAAEAFVSIFDHGLLYGDGLFETVRVYEGRPFRLRQHLERLREGAVALRLALPWSAEALTAMVEETVRANRLQDGALRLTVTRGAGPPVPDPAVCPQPTCFVTAREWSPPPPAAYERGYRAIVAEGRQNERSPLSRLKTLNYGLHLLARMEARDAGLDEALLLNQAGAVAEAATANLFAVIGGRLSTPPPSAGCLPGITRAAVLDLADKGGLSTCEVLFDLQDLRAAEEAFLTNSLLEVMPLVEVDGIPIGKGRPGAVTRQLLDAYRALVRREVGVGYYA
ncbi:MAG: aminotransferase class IV [Armatimonadetes bacterium]|nr:aminotransferase class IV [Armatimonadota bacterium]